MHKYTTYRIYQYCYLKIYLITWILILFTTNTYALNDSNTSTISKPNILFILVDDLGWNDIGFHTSCEFKTPHIDNLAINYGLQLNNYYVQSVCSASRSALLSGRYPIKTGMQHTILQPNDPYGLPLQFTLLPQDLQTAGYNTNILGKWNLGYFHTSYTPTYRGFDTFYGFYNGMEDFYNHTVTVSFNGTEHTHYDLFDNTNIVNDTMLNTYSTYIYGNKTMDIFRQYANTTNNTKKPLFIFLSLQNLHSPLQAPKAIIDAVPDITANKRKIKAAKAIVVDNVIGSIVQQLNNTQLWQNLLIIFSTDNGAPSNDGGSNYPLRGAKGTLWEGGVRGTAFISGGYLNSSRYGDITNEAIHITDFYPTIMDIVGRAATDVNNLDGKSFLHVMQNKNGKSHRNETLLDIDIEHCNNNYHACGAIRIDDWKLIVGNIGTRVTKFVDLCDATWCAHTDATYLDNTLSENSTVCDITYFNTHINNIWNSTNIYNQCPFNGKPCLYNLVKDPCEFHDVAEANSDIVHKALRRLWFYTSQTVTPLNVLNQAVDPASMNIQSNYWTPWKNTSDMIMWNMNTSKPTTMGPTTEAPSISPTLEPTITHIINTTVSPSMLPSLIPSQNPSKNPTLSPSVISTKSPTFSPSMGPTEVTEHPSNSPTFTHETSAPTKLPTPSPTMEPTGKPSTAQPTLSPLTMQPSMSPEFTFDPTNSPTFSQPTLSPSTIQPSMNPTNSPTFSPTTSPTVAGRVVTEVPSKGKNKYMTAFYLVSIAAILGCGCLICIGICYKRSKNKNRMRHRRLEDSLKGIELRSVIRPQRGGGEYSGLLN